MTGYRCLEVPADTTDRFLPLIGAGADYAASGRSFYTVETHIRHLGEAHAGDRLAVTTQLLGHDAKRLHLFHELRRADDGTRVATSEHMLLHVDATAGRAVAADAEVVAALERIAVAQAGLPRPRGSPLDRRRSGARPGPRPIRTDRGTGRPAGWRPALGYGITRASTFEQIIKTKECQTCRQTT